MCALPALSQARMSDPTMWHQLMRPAAARRLVACQWGAGGLPPCSPSYLAGAPAQRLGIPGGPGMCSLKWALPGRREELFSGQNTCAKAPTPGSLGGLGMMAARQDAKVFIGGLSWETTGEGSVGPGPDHAPLRSLWTALQPRPRAGPRTLFPRTLPPINADEKLRRYFENYGTVQGEFAAQGCDGGICALAMGCCACDWRAHNSASRAFPELRTTTF